MNRSCARRPAGTASCRSLEEALAQHDEVERASRDALDIGGLGRGTAERLVETGLVKDVSDVLALREPDLRALERFGDLSARSLAAGIERAQHTDLGRFLYALGRLDGREVLMNAGEQELVEAGGVGLVTAHAIASCFGDEDESFRLTRWPRPRSLRDDD